MTSHELTMSLNTLKKNVDYIDYSSLKNVVFFNIESLYLYVNQFSLPDAPGIEKILDLIEEYIPCIISEENLELLVTIPLTKDPDEANEMEKKFKTHMRLNFINLVRNAKSESEWSHVSSVCERIRKSVEGMQAVYD